MDQRVGVNQLDRSRNSIELGSLSVLAAVYTLDGGLVCSHGQQRPDPFAAGADGVSGSRPERRPERRDQTSDRRLESRAFDRYELFDAIQTRRACDATRG